VAGGVEVEVFAYAGVFCQVFEVGVGVGGDAADGFVENFGFGIIFFVAREKGK
jgi:hypothetical protein